MDEESFEGTLILEKLALIGRVDESFEAVDADDPVKAASLLRQANVDAETIELVLEKMANGDDD